MKAIAILIPLFCCLHAYADCQDEWLSHTSEKVDLTVRYSEGCYKGDLILDFSSKGRGQKNASIKSMPFHRECPSKKMDKNGVVSEFSCRKDGQSPLAGATYRFKTMKTTLWCNGIAEPDEQYAFVCVSGCTPATPKKLIVSFGEGCS